MAKRSRSGARKASLGEVAVMAVAGWPLSSIPPMMAPAMLPAPIKVTLLAIVNGPSVVCWWLSGAGPSRYRLGFPGAEDRCAQPYQGGTFKDGRFQIIAHAHRQGIQLCLGEAGAQCFQRLVQAGQWCPLGFQGGSGSRDRH